MLLWVETWQAQCIHRIAELAGLGNVIIQLILYIFQFWINHLTSSPQAQFQKGKKCNMYALWRLTSLRVKRSWWAAMFALCSTLLVVGVIFEVAHRMPYFSVLGILKYDSLVGQLTMFLSLLLMSLLMSLLLFMLLRLLFLLRFVIIDAFRSNSLRTRKSEYALR